MESFNAIQKMIQSKTESHINTVSVLRVNEKRPAVPNKYMGEYSKVIQKNPSKEKSLLSIRHKLILLMVPKKNCGTLHVFFRRRDMKS